MPFGKWRLREGADKTLRQSYQSTPSRKLHDLEIVTLVPAWFGPNFGPKTFYGLDILIKLMMQHFHKNISVRDRFVQFIFSSSTLLKHSRTLNGIPDNEMLPSSSPPRRSRKQKIDLAREKRGAVIGSSNSGTASPFQCFDISLCDIFQWTSVQVGTTLE